MAFCGKCGADMGDAKFCPSCGTPAGASGSEPTAQSSQSDADQNKAMGILAYFGLLFLVPLLAAKESPFAQFHARQGFNLCLLWIAVAIVVTILSVISFWLGSIFTLLYLGVTVLAIIGIINAAKGEMKELPIIGGIKILK